MKTLIIIIFTLIFSQGSFASEAKNFWTTSQQEDVVSCPLYRKRVANYYQRISEFEHAQKALKGQLTVSEISSLSELAQRTGIPLLTNETATYSGSVFIGEWAKLIDSSLIAVSIQSELVNWEADHLVFPDSVIDVKIDPSTKILTVKFKMQLAQACLHSSSLYLGFRFNDQRRVDFTFPIDKTQWDSSYIAQSTSVEQLKYILGLERTGAYELGAIAQAIENSQINSEDSSSILQMIITSEKSNCYTLANVASAILNSKNPVENGEEMLNEIIGSSVMCSYSLERVVESTLIAKISLDKKVEILQHVLNSDYNNAESDKEILDDIIYLQTSATADMLNAFVTSKHRTANKLASVVQILASTKLEFDGVLDIVKDIIHSPSADTYVLYKITDYILNSSNLSIINNQNILLSSVDKNIVSECIQKFDHKNKYGW
jgi:hypothetical protein